MYFVSPSLADPPVAATITAGALAKGMEQYSITFNSDNFEALCLAANAEGEEVISELDEALDGAGCEDHGREVSTKRRRMQVEYIDE